MPATGFLLPAARTVDAGSGTWTNDVNILADDGAEATFSLTSKNTTGRSLRGQNFGFDSAIPAGATINQVQIRMEYRVNNTGGVANPEMQAFVSGAAVGSVRAGSPAEPTTLTINTFDVTADRAWTRADLLDGVFEIRCWGRNGNSTTDPSYRWDYVAAEVTYTAQQTVTLGQPAETESVMAVTVRKVVVLQMVRAQITWDESPVTWDGLAATWDFGELETGRPATPLRQVPAGLTTETETAQSVTLGAAGGGQTIPLGLVTETETSQGVTLRENVTAGLSSETETALPVAARRTVTLGLATEAETAQSATARRVVAAGQPSETETALAAAVRENVAIGQPSETETAQSVSVGGPLIITLGQVVETETARTVTLTRTVTAGQPAETETTQSVLVLKHVTLAQLVEAETAQAIVAGTFLPDPYPAHDVYRESSTRSVLGAASHAVYRETSHDTYNSTAHDIYQEGT